MELIASLQLNFARTPAPAGPRNLLELAALLEQPQVRPEVASWCDLWADQLVGLKRAEQQRFATTRGPLRRLWAEQALIYQDLIELLREVGEVIRRPASRPGKLAEDFRLLLEEFAESLQEMQAAHESEQPRCPACAWEGAELQCPHCRVHLLIPARERRDVEASMQLQAHHQQLHDHLVAVLTGKLDLTSLAQPLGSLREDFQAAALDAQAHLTFHPEMEAVSESLQLAVDGLEEMERVFDDLDSQHLEDGWNAFYVSQLTIAELLNASDLAI